LGRWFLVTEKERDIRKSEEKTAESRDCGSLTIRNSKSVYAISPHFIKLLPSQGVGTSCTQVPIQRKESFTPCILEDYHFLYYVNSVVEKLVGTRMGRQGECRAGAGGGGAKNKMAQRQKAGR
jgi:hypothetical protein